MNNKGFTLVELLATISILAIISLIAVPSVLTITTNNKNKAYINDAKIFVTDIESYMIKYPSDKTKISLSDISEESFSSPDNIDYNSTSCYLVSAKEVCLTNGKKSINCSVSELNSNNAIENCIKQNDVCNGKC